MYEGADTVVLYDQLAYHDVLPVQWLALPSPPDRFELIGIEEANVLLLQACVSVEEHPARDQNEDLGPLAHEIARLDFKLNLVMQLLSKLVTRDKMPPATNIDFNGLGASWLCVGKPPSVGEHGLLRVQLRSSLPQPLELPAEVVAVDSSTAKVKFPALSEALVELIQRLAFLRHRRQVADARKARG
jgi:atypical PilZ domain-containing cyclic di-GMP receptor